MTNKILKTQLTIALIISWAVMIGLFLAKRSYSPSLLTQDVVEIIGCEEVPTGYGNLLVKSKQSNQISELQILINRNYICEFIKEDRMNNFSLLFYKKIVVGLSTLNKTLIDAEKGRSSYEKKSSIVFLILILFNFFMASVILAKIFMRKS